MGTGEARHPGTVCPGHSLTTDPSPTVQISIPNKHHTHQEAIQIVTLPSPGPDWPDLWRWPRALRSGAFKAKSGARHRLARTSRLDATASLTPQHSRPLVIWPQFTTPKSNGTLSPLNHIPSTPNKLVTLPETGLAPYTFTRTTSPSGMWPPLHPLAHCYPWKLILNAIQRHPH